MKIKNIEGIKLALNSKLNGLICPMCRSDKGFTPFSQEFQGLAFAREKNVLDISNIQYISCISCRCNNCGFIANFDLDVVTGDSNYSKA